MEEICHHYSTNSIYHIRNSFCRCGINTKLWLSKNTFIDRRCNRGHVFLFIRSLLQTKLLILNKLVSIVIIVIAVVIVDVGVWMRCAVRLLMMLAQVMVG